MKKTGVTINFNLSNRAIYSLITLVLILIVSVGVYASTHGVSHDWTTEIMGIPADILDGDDDYCYGGVCGSSIKINKMIYSSAPACDSSTVGLITFQEYSSAAILPTACVLTGGSYAWRILS